MDRRHVRPRGDRFHEGIDFPAGKGTRVRAAAAGVVEWAGWTDGGYGNLVVVSHGDGYRTYYAHLASVSVEAGQRVRAGSVVGRVGSTGHSSGPHLHFELRLGEAALDPAPSLG
ncbi:MAG: M23 family metallopeptidase [Thermoleophilia bacterium]